MAQPVLFGLVGERAVAIVDVEHVPSVHREEVDARDVDVDAPVTVHVGHGDAGLPPISVGDARLIGDVLELIVALVPVKLVGAEVRGKIKILQPVPIHVPNGDAAAVVVVEIVQDVEVGLLRELVDEADAR